MAWNCYGNGYQFNFNITHFHVVNGSTVTWADDPRADANQHSTADNMRRPAAPPASSSTADADAASTSSSDLTGPAQETTNLLNLARQIRQHNMNVMASAHNEGTAASSTDPSAGAGSTALPDVGRPAEETTDLTRPAQETTNLLALARQIRQHNMNVMAAARNEGTAANSDRPAAPPGASSTDQSDGAASTTSPDLTRPAEETTNLLNLARQIRQHNMRVMASSPHNGAVVLGRDLHMTQPTAANREHQAAGPGASSTAEAATASTTSPDMARQEEETTNVWDIFRQVRQHNMNMMVAARNSGAVVEEVDLEVFLERPAVAPAASSTARQSDGAGSTTSAAAARPALGASGYWGLARPSQPQQSVTAAAASSDNRIELVLEGGREKIVVSREWLRQQSEKFGITGGDDR